MIVIDKSQFKFYLQDNLNRVGCHYKQTASKEVNLDILSYILDAFYYKKYKDTDFCKFIQFDKFVITQMVDKEIRYLNLIPDRGRENILL